MTEIQVAIIMGYLLIGLFLADMLMVKVDYGYWMVLLLWPLLILILILAMIALFILSLFLPRNFTP